MNSPSRNTRETCGASLDTSGVVTHFNPQTHHTDSAIWSDISPFEQGYVEAMLRSLPPFTDRGREYCVQFHRLAPETLAAIRKDCAAFKAEGYGSDDDDAVDGSMFWGTRQNREWEDVGFPPLTVTLGDDGKVRTSPVDGTSDRQRNPGTPSDPLPRKDSK